MKIGRTEKHVANFYYEKEFVVHIKKLKQALNHELVLKKNAQSQYIQSRNLTKAIHWYEYRTIKKAKTDFGKDFFSIW